MERSRPLKKPPPHSEPSIIARVQAGETGAFEHLVRTYQDALFRLVGNLVDAVQVEDIVQEVFMTAFEKIRRFDPRRGSFRTWIYTIARNKTYNHCRRKKLLSWVSWEHAPEQPDLRTPERAVENKTAFQRLDRALGQLNYKERAVFVLADIEGLPYETIARIEKVRLGTVKSRLARTRAKLRAALQEMET